MKTVYSNHEIPHKWAYAEEGDFFRNSSESYSARGFSLYSYATEIGRIEETKAGRIAFISDGSYSNTTAGHISAGAMAVSHLETFPAVAALRGGRMDCTPRAVADLLSQQIREELEKAAKARKNQAFHLDHAENLRDKMEQLSKHFPRFRFLKRHRLAMESAEIPNLSELKEKLKKERAANKRKKELREKKLLSEKKEQIADWRAGKLDTWNHSLRSLPCMLRISADGEQVETSHGAKVSKKAACAAFQALKAGKKLCGMSLDGYTITAANSHRVKIGCHEISIKEIDSLLSNISASATY